MMGLSLIIAIPAFIIKWCIFEFDEHSLYHVGMLILSLLLFKISTFLGVVTYIGCLIWLFSS